LNIRAVDSDRTIGEIIYTSMFVQSTQQHAVCNIYFEDWLNFNTAEKKLKLKVVMKLTIH